MKVELSVSIRRMTEEPIVLNVPDDVEDLEGYLRDFVFDHVVKASFKVVHHVHEY
jgi:hypothetical protein